MKESGEMDSNLLEMKGITKRFGKLTADDSVDLSVKSGEVHALLGENGAGKTTLMNILYGIYKADNGQILFHGKPLKLNTPRDAIKAGIGMVHQHFMLVQTMTVLENIILGLSDDLKKLDLKSPREKVLDLCSTYHFDLDPDAKVSDLSVGAQQRVELVKALYRGAELLILDEPTAVLTPQEVEELFVILRKLVGQGKSIILISHKLWEVKEISDRCTVLRAGKLVGTVNTADVEEKDIAAMMVGREISLTYDKTPVKKDKVVLEAERISAAGNNQASSIKKMDLKIYAGEIVGIAGVDGNGQNTLGDALMGLIPLTEGNLRYLGEDITNKPTRSRIHSGFAYIPEDRMTQGLIMDFSLSENYVIKHYEDSPYTTGKIFFHSKAVKEEGTVLTKEYDVRPDNPSALARSLSGGNQQKVILARELSDDPEMIIAMQPTRGLDIGASDFVHSKLLQAKERGAGVLLVSADLDEILAVCDRVLVINEGRIMGEFVPGEISGGEIGLMMGGIAQKKEEKQE